MNLNDCYRLAIDEMIQSGDRYTTEDVLDRALELNGAVDEFSDRALDKARAQAKREIKAIMRSYLDDAIADDDPQGQLFSLLPFRPTRVVALHGDHAGEYAYKDYGSSTATDREEHIAIKDENIARAREQVRRDRINHQFLNDNSGGPDTTAREALRMAATKAA